MAAFGGLGFATTAQAAKPSKPGPNEKLAKEQAFRFGGGGWFQNDPASHDFNKDLYCSGVPALFAGLMVFNADFVSVPWMASQVGVHAKQDWTLEVTLDGPRGYFPVLAAYLAALPAHRGAVEKFGDKWTEAGNIVSNGPFTLEAWEHNKQIVLKKNPHYFGA